MKIYIASSEKYIGKIQEDIYMCEVYKRKGFFSKIVTMEEIVNISESFDLVILKSIWGYYTDYKKFIKQIVALKKKRIKLVNDYDFIFWNIDKGKYLCEIKHINIVPTIYLRLKRTKSVFEIKNAILKASKVLKAEVLVIKPCVSESGYLTLKYDINKDNKTTITLLKKNKNFDFIIQPYRSDISKGEISVIIINGVPLYGIKRFPGIFGNKLKPTYIKMANIPNDIKIKLVLLENFFLKKFGMLPNICRVDFLKFNTSFEILEVELIDPDLFFRYIPEGIKKKATSSLNKSLTI